MMFLVGGFVRKSIDPSHDLSSGVGETFGKVALRIERLFFSYSEISMAVSLEAGRALDCAV
jgi:hypothetical protein